MAFLNLDPGTMADLFVLIEREIPVCLKSVSHNAVIVEANVMNEVYGYPLYLVKLCRTDLARDAGQFYIRRVSSSPSTFIIECAATGRYLSCGSLYLSKPKPTNLLSFQFPQVGLVNDVPQVLWTIKRCGSWYELELHNELLAVTRVTGQDAVRLCPVATGNAAAKWKILPYCQVVPQVVDRIANNSTNGGDCEVTVHVERGYTGNQSLSMELVQKVIRELNANLSCNLTEAMTTGQGQATGSNNSSAFKAGVDSKHSTQSEWKYTSSVSSSFTAKRSETRKLNLKFHTPVFLYQLMFEIQIYGETKWQMFSDGLYICDSRPRVAEMWKQP